MFDSQWDPGFVVHWVVVIAAVAGIAVYLVRGFRHKSRKPWPALFVGIYTILLLFLYLFAVLTDVSSEGFGTIPLLALTSPWSWLVMWLLNATGALDSISLAKNIAVVVLFNVAVFALPSAVNSYILYLLVKRHEKKAAEDVAWEQARRNR